MTSLTPEDQLLRAVLQRAERSSHHVPTIRHLDDETMALFADGQLPARDRPTVIEHLADCASCRQLVAALWQSDDPTASATASASRRASAPGHETAPVPETVNVRGLTPSGSPALGSPITGLPALRFVVIGLAAMALVAVGLWWRVTPSNTLAERRAYQQSQQLLTVSDFEQARRVLAQARQQGIRSDRLLSLNSQAVRQLPGTLALASSGTLTDFGYDFDGTLARGPTQQRGLREADAMLAEAQSEPLELLLNRGHLRLSQNDFEAAVVDFQRATQTAPREPLAWLGLGLAEFARQNFEAADAAFRQCLSLVPDHVPARINRALTLEELDRLDDARAEWRLVLTKTPSELVRRRIEQHLKALE